MILKKLFNHNGRIFVKISSSFYTTKMKDADQCNISFNDSKIAYCAKSNLEIIRALVVFKLCSINFLVDNNKQILNICRKFFGKNIFEFIMKNTVYGHFVAGENQEDIKELIKKNRDYGVKSILDYCAEEDISDEKAKKIVKDTMEIVLDQHDKGPQSLDVKFQTNVDFANRQDKVTCARTYFYTSEEQCDKNVSHFKKCIDASCYTANEREGFIAVKLTSLGPPQLLMHVSDILIQLQNVFNILTEHIDHKSPIGSIKFDLQSFQERLKDLHIEISCDEQLKWFTLLDMNNDSYIDLFDWLNLKNFEHNLAEIFKIKDSQTGVLQTLIQPLSEEGIQSLRHMLLRLDEIVQYAQHNKVRIMIDAEQSYFQPAIRRITLELMRHFNKKEAIVFNTYQCYLKDALEHVNSDLTFAEQEDFFFGAKLVRGAYMEQERDRAKVQKYMDPINSTFEDTTNMYYKSMDSVFQSILRRPRGKVLVMIASHNMETIKTAVKKLSNNSILPEEKLICFGQLLGMCDHISFTLGKEGYSVYKYMPYGLVEEVLPYLSRRVLENRAVLAKCKDEQRLLWCELKRRLKAT